MALEEPIFVTYAQAMFKKHGSDYNIIKGKFTDLKERQKFEVYCHFYFFICRPDLPEEAVRDELRFLGMTSLMEALMTYSNDLEVRDLGSKQKIVEYFRRYFAEGKEEIEHSGVSIWPDGAEHPVPIRKIDEIAKFLYDMRNEFAHEAEMHGLKPARVNGAFTTVKGIIYDIEITVGEFLASFERSFVRYWVERAE